MGDAVLVYDDDCGFCTWWAEFFAPRSDIRIVGFTEVDDDLRDRLPAGYEECSHLVTDDAVYSCGSSLEEAFLRADRGRAIRPVIEFLRNFGDYERVRERCYRWIADRRDLWGRVLSKTPPARQDSNPD